MSISPKRILYLDEVRSLAIILVVIGHVSRLFSYDFYSWLFCSGVFSLTRIGVPLFFTVSGSLLLTRKYENSAGSYVSPLNETNIQNGVLMENLVYLVTHWSLSSYSSSRQLHS